MENNEILQEEESSILTLTDENGVDWQIVCLERKNTPSAFVADGVFLC